MARVHLLGELRRQCDDHRLVEVEAGNVRELVAALEERFPALRQSGLGRMSVAIDGEVMPNADFEQIGPGSDIHFVPAISGG